MQNLKSLFQSTPKPIPKSIKHHDDKIVLFKRRHSDNWHCRFKLPTGQWHHSSTSEHLLDAAKSQSVVIYETAQINIRNGLSLSQHSFGQVAKEVIDDMSADAALGRGKKTYRDYKIVLQKYLIPFFGNSEIGSITLAQLREFEAWRLSQMGMRAKSSTLRNHASAYNRVIKFARQNGYISDSKPIPILSAIGEKGKPRPAFTQEEIQHLLNFMPQWEQGSFMKIYNDYRKLCRCYVEFLLYTGIRQGTESLPLRWKHLQWHLVDNQRYLRIWVSGKTGPRYLIARPAVLDTLNRLIKFQELPYQNLDEVIEARLEKRVFTIASGEQPRSFESVFRGLLNKAGLRRDESGRFRSLYSLRHTYATMALTEGIDIHTLARQMGTSIAMIERHYSKITPLMEAEKLAY